MCVHVYFLARKLMRIVALDIGDVWTGIAMSDPLQMFAKPHRTSRTDELISTLKLLIAEYNIKTVVIGFPRTMRNTISEQTQKVLNYKDLLEKTFPEITWPLWDERLSSRQASSIKSPKNKQEKIESHSLAAAVILDGYLARLRFQKSLETSDDTLLE
jgi:putative Holliday junction resolvase